MIKRVYYVEGLNHNLFSVGQFYDADLEVAFRKSMCFIRDLKGNDLLTGSRGTYLYSITLQDSNSPNPICLMAKATSSQAWLWHRRLSHLNFDIINLLSKNDIVVGLPKLKFVKDHLCPSCELGKAKRKSFHSKLTPSLKRRLHLLHMDFVQKGFNTKRPLLEHLNRMALSKDETKEAQIKLYKTREDKELDKVIELENKVKVLDNIVYKTGQSVQTMNMLNNKCRTSFAKHEFLKKAQRENLRLYDIGYYNDNLALMLAPDSDNVIQLLEKCEGLETEISKSKMMSKSFESVQKHAINLELELQQCKEKIENDKPFKVNQTKDFCKERKQYFRIQNLKAQLQDKGIVISELKKHIEKLKGKFVDTNLNAKTLNVKSVSAMCDKCVLHDKHDMCVLNSVAKPSKRTVASESNKKPRNFTRKLYEHVSKTCSWWYSKFTPSGYKWKPKSGKENVNLNISMPLGNTSRTANVMDTMTSRRSTVSNNPLSSKFFCSS
nr:retrovirus-related Pol polyprotein from transposon TNT 1-94 [Tanacetum cinerariifolium]